ncbi:MAG: polysaccharide biosynthesis protein [Candidatus Limnocylindria bacterium]
MLAIPEEQLVPLVLRRTTSLFAPDVKANTPNLTTAIRGARVLVAGAAGSIGSAFVKELCRYRPADLTLIDVDENGLVELVRDLRSGVDSIVGEFRTLAIGLGTREFEHYVRQAHPVDYFVNFAALKHVRSERDPQTLMRLLDTNVLALERSASVLLARGRPKLFSVSSDKAVRPANLMGASKRWMERILAAHSGMSAVGSARFANVAFSRGSLLEGFLNRIAKRQPIAAPSDIKRYFISSREAAELCLLACFVGQDREVFVPRATDGMSAIGMVDVAQIVLKAFGLEPERFASAEEARRSELLKQTKPTRWPCYFHESATSGEKSLEEFVGPTEQVAASRFDAIDVVTMEPHEHDAARIADARLRLMQLRDLDTWRKEDIVEIVRMAVPELEYQDRGPSLDDRM